MFKRCFALCLILVVCIPALAQPKKKTYDNSADDVFNAALRTARERHVVTYVNEKVLMFTFETGHSFFTKGFVANASVEPQGANQATLILNVQTKDGDAAWGAGGRMADKFFVQVTEELAGEVKQKSTIRPEQASVVVPPPKAVPPEPALTRPPDEKGTVLLAASPENAEVSVDGNFVGNAPVVLKLLPGKHTIGVTAHGYQGMTRDINVLPDSEVHLNAVLDRS